MEKSESGNFRRGQGADALFLVFETPAAGWKMLEHCPKTEFENDWNHKNFLSESLGSSV
jgi:hypothetical protein